MKKIFFLSILTLLSFLSFSQPTIQWQKSLGGSSDEVATSIQQTSDS